MIGVILACAFFGFGTALILIEIKNFWRKSAAEILSAPGGGSNPGLQRRMRMALPAGALLTGSFFLAAAFAVLSGLGVNVGSYLAVLFLAFTGVSGLGGAAAMFLGVPRFLLLPAFRTQEAFKQSLDGAP